MLYPGHVPRDAPEMAYALPEGVLGEAEDIVAIKPVLNDVYETSFNKWGVKYLATFISTNKTINIYCKEPVESLDEIREKKLRVWGKALADTFAKLDVSATIIPQNDMYVALQTGVVDCATHYPGAASTLSPQEVTPYWSYLSAYAVPIPLVVSHKPRDELPDHVQAILSEEAEKLSAELADALLAGNYELVESEKFDAAGGQKLEDLPVVLPVLTGLGFDPVWPGVMITLMIEVGLMQAAWATLPFWLVMTAAIAILTLLPQIVLFLPRLM